MAHFLPPKISSSTQQQQQHSTRPETPRSHPDVHVSRAPRASERPPRPPTPAIKDKDKDRDRPRDRVRSHQTSSLSGWVKNILPSHRSERGGTRRNQGFWEEVESTTGRSPRRFLAESHQSAGGESVNSNRITRWNVPRDLSEGPAPSRPGHHLVASPAGPPPSRGQHRPWPWSRDNGSESQLPMAKLGGFLQTPQSERSPADQKAGRRWSEAHRAVHRSLESRRRRQSLKRSGDYLGVQGINPRTGEFDVMTPTDSTPRSSLSADSDGKVKPLWKLLQKNDKTRGRRLGEEGEEEKVMEEAKFARLQRRKEMLKTIGKSVRWRRRKKEWSSAQEPDLSPITQSLRSTSPISRRQSRMRKLSNDDSFLDRLINRKASKAGRRQLAPSKESVLEDLAPDTIMYYSSNSSGTIIKTPHRRSFTHATPAAWELFDNGIEFSTCSSGAAGPQPHAHETADVPPSPDQKPLQGAQDLGNRELPAASSPPSELGMPDAKLPMGPQLPKTDDGGDFLGIRASFDIDPGDTREDTTSRSSSIPPKSVPEQAAVEKSETRFLVKRKPLRSAVPHVLRLRKQKSDGDNLQKHLLKMKALPLLHRHSVLTLRSRGMETAWSLPAADRETDLPSSQVQESSLHSLKSTAALSPRAHGERLDQEVVDITVQVKEGKAMDSCASIPTTTITGCDLTMSQLSPSGGISEETKALSQEICELRMPSSSGISAKPSPARPPLNTVPSTRSPVEHVPAIATISKGTLPKRQSLETGEERDRSTSPTSTSTLSRVLAPQSTWDRQVEVGRKTQQTKPPFLYPPEKIPSRRRIRKLPSQTTSGVRHEENTWGPGRAHMQEVARARAAGEPRLVRCPGGYPPDLGDDGDTDGPLFSELVVSCYRNVSWRDAAFLHAAVHLGSSLLCLCWIMVRSILYLGVSYS